MLFNNDGVGWALRGFEVEGHSALTRQAKPEAEAEGQSSLLIKDEVINHGIGPSLSCYDLQACGNIVRVLLSLSLFSPFSALCNARWGVDQFIYGSYSLFSEQPHIYQILPASILNLFLGFFPLYIYKELLLFTLWQWYWVNCIILNFVVFHRTKLHTFVIMLHLFYGSFASKNKPDVHISYQLTNPQKQILP